MNDWLTDLEQLITDCPADGETPLATLERLDQVLAARPAELDLTEPIQRLAEELERSGDHALWLRYARAWLQEEAGIAGAVRGYVRVAEMLSREGAWPAARYVLRRALAMHPEPELIDLLLRNSRRLSEVERESDLELAASLAPASAPVLWAQSQAAQDRGQGPRASELAARALRSFLEENQVGEAEDALLVALENPSVPTAQALIELLPTMIEQGAPQLADVALDLLGPVVAQYHLDEVLLSALEKMISRSGSDPGLRERYLETVIQQRGDPEAIRAAAAEVKFLSIELPFEKTRLAFWRALEFAPGALVKHLRWGVGRITSATSQSLTIDFPGQPGHQMARSMAARSLTPLASTSLEAQIALNLGELRREAKTDSVALLLRVIDECQGEATPALFKKWLAGTIISESQWSSWWREARQIATHDARLDHSQAFAGHYRRASAEAAGAGLELPPLKRQDGLTGAVSMIRDLLREHPGLAEEASARYRVVLSDWLRSDEPLEARVLAALLLANWRPQERERWGKWIARVIVDTDSLNFLTTSPDQRAALDLALETAYSSSVLVVALGSRFSDIRDYARARIQALGEEAPALLWNYLRDPQTPPPIQAEVAALTLNPFSSWDEDHNPWSVVLALVRALAQAQAGRDVSAMGALLSPDAPLSQFVRKWTCPQEIEIALEGAVLDLRRLILPRRQESPQVRVVRDFLAAVEHGEFVALLQAPEEQQVQRIAPELDSSILLMTHQTYEEKVLRRDQLQHELATVIPELIAKARALGDLSENADYHAARERQGLAAAEVRALESVIECTRLIEKLDIDEEVASAGTEVRLQDPSGHERVFWILGQDDGYHGPEVINYRAELGQALIGHRVGDEVTVELDGERVTCRLVAIRRRMPDVLAELERYRAHRGQFTD